MSEGVPLPLRLYLPLLTHADAAVRRQSGLLLRNSGGAGVVLQLRRLLKSPEPELREQARQALQALGELSDIEGWPAEAAGIVVRCLGSMQVALDGVALGPSNWAQAEGGRAGGQKVRAVFAYLVHCGGRGSTRESLGEAVWGGGASSVSIARTLTTMRQALIAVGGEDLVNTALVIGQERCTLVPDAYTSDVELFEQVYAQAWQSEERLGLGAAAELYAQALDLYGGPYLSDIARGSGWMEERRAALAGDFVIATERLAEWLYGQGRYAECIRRCQQALDDTPAAEEAAVWLLRAYGQLDRRAELEQCYRRYLRAAHLDPGSDDAASDAVVQEYEALREHAVNASE